ncbi:MAG TPA: AMP-binding protein [Syntrophorhabdaceae bacterium]|nr:AMP-binding protein [Syntrophorhabdaceae bacterium]
MNLARNLEVSAQFFPNKPAIREGELELTYAQLNENANKVATGLIKLGVKPGELVGMCAPNSADWITVYFGIIKTGAVAVTIANASSPDELTNLLNHAKPRLLFTTPDRIETLKHLKAPGMLEKIICSADCDLTLKQVMEMGTNAFRAVERERDDTVAILFTGGTTGMPKGVMLTHEGISLSAHNIAYCEHSTPDDFALCFLPFNHVFGQIHIMNSTIYSAGCLELIPVLDMEKVLSLTESGKVTKFFSVPTVYVRLLQIPDLKKKLGNVRYCFSAGASMAQEIVKQWKEKTGITIAESLGMTECMPIVFNHFYPEKHVVGAVGQPVQGMEVQIRHTSGHVMELGQEGEICVRSRSVMKGYLNNPEATKETFWDGGWLRTGDIGYIDDMGYLYIVDRLKDLIITGGENVSPREVEEFLYTVPEIEECAVIGLSDKEWGERVVAFIVAKPGQTVEPDKVKAYLKTRLAPFKVPKEYRILSELPKSPAGKILKREVKRLYGN